MTVGPKTVFAQTPIETALVAMRAGRFRRLPVVDRGNKLVGLITLDDILMLLAEEFSQIGRLLKRESPRSIMEELTSSLGTVTRFRSEARLGVGD
jgi:CBS-domain-containing membrane protein